jgi:predicted negative regulator of RcsB-dependent stress response
MSTEEQLSQIKGVNKITSFYDQNKKGITAAAVVIILLSVGIYYYTNFYKPGREEKAQAAIFMAQRYFQQDSTQKALYGDGINLGMMDVADQFGSTKAGNLAKLYAGRLLLTEGKYEDAKKYLSDVSLDDNFFAPGAKILLGDAYAELGDYKKAGDTYLKAAKMRDNDVTAPKALMKAALAYEASNEYNAAIEALDLMTSEHYDETKAEEVKRLRGRIEAEIYADKNK